MQNYEAMFYNPLPNDKVQCQLCPHYCVLQDGEMGKCRSRKNVEGVLYAINYGRTISVSIDPIEKKPLYHYYPGTSILSLGPNSCNFSCKFCQNYSISLYEAPTKSVTKEEILELLKKYKIDKVAFTYTEPFTWYEFIYDAAVYLKENDIKIVMITNGFVNKEPLEKLLPYIDAMNIDLKSMEEEFYREICGGMLEPVLKTIELSYNKTHIEITNLLITAENDKDANIQKIVDFVAKIDKDIPLHFSRYYPTYEMIDPPTPLSTMKNAYEIARKKLSNVYLGNILTDDEANTHCPRCNNLLIKRTGYETKIIGLKQGKCDSCGKEIFGVWKI